MQRGEEERNRLTDKLTGYETGRRMPDAEMICSVADYFHVSVDFLLRHEGEPNCTSYNQKRER